MLPKILFFSYHQFGSLVDTLKYCECLKDRFNITYLGWDYGKTKTSIKGVDVKYVSRSGNILNRNVKLLAALHAEIKNGNYDLIFMHYTRGISLVRLLNFKTKMIFDVRTLSVDRNYLKRKTYNLCLKLESLFFKNCSIISEGIGIQLRLRKYHLLPLGADAIPLTKAQIDRNRLKLLYVGTLQNRDIIKCVKGFHEYITTTGDRGIEMTIVGDSSGNELNEIREYINQHKVLMGKVNCTGRIAYSELGSYFANADVGISFIPMTQWYDYQPATKTLEYLLSGLPVIATKTFENKSILKNEGASILINDDAKDFCYAIPVIKEKLMKLHPEELQSRYKKHLWVNVVDDYLIKIIDNVR